jgi:general secretion pathway protein K
MNLEGKEKIKRKNEKGVALLITLFAITIMTFLAVEIAYNTHVEMRVGAAQVDRLKAYYLAKSGIQLSLLRINAYKIVSSKFGAALGANKSDLDLIWKFPFAWPPIVPDEESDLDKEQIKAVVKKSTIDGAFVATIDTEAGKIDINDLNSPSPAIQKATNAELVLMIQNRLNIDDTWARNHRNLKPQEIVNNITDWIDEDNASRNGGSETDYYQDTDPPIKPPNRSMKTIDELHMVAGMTDEIYNVIAPRLTLWGDKGINVNYAPKDVIRSIDPQITDQIGDAIIERRTDESKGPFSDEKDFDTFIQSEGVNLATFNKNPVIAILTEGGTNFRIKSTGIFGKAQREIVAIVYDFDTVKAEIQKNMAAASPTPGGQGQGTPLPTPIGTPAGTPGGTPTPGSSPSGNGVPQIVFWQEL